MMQKGMHIIAFSRTSLERNFVQIIVWKTNNVHGSQMMIMQLNHEGRGKRAPSVS